MTRKPARKNDDSRNYLMLGTGAIALGAVAGILWFGSQNLMAPPASAPQAGQKTSPVAQTPARPSEPAPEVAVSGTGSDAIRFRETLAPEPVAGPEASEENTAEEGLQVPFEIEEIAGALGVLQLDEDGNLVLDHTAHGLLEEAFLFRDPMDESQLEELRALIETGLGGAAGEQAAEVAERFFRYSSAFREISDTIGMRSDPRSLKNDYEQVMRLRRAHLGPELAEQIYGAEEKLTRYTLETMDIQNDPALSDEERESRQQAAADAAGIMLDNSQDPDEESGNLQN